MAVFATETGLHIDSAQARDIDYHSLWCTGWCSLVLHQSIGSRPVLRNQYQLSVARQNKEATLQGELIRRTDETRYLVHYSGYRCCRITGISGRLRATSSASCAKAVPSSRSCPCSCACSHSRLCANSYPLQMASRIQIHLIRNRLNKQHSS